MKSAFLTYISGQAAVFLTTSTFIVTADVASAQGYRDCSAAMSQLDATFCAKDGWDAVDAELNALCSILKPQADATGWGQSLLDAQRGWLRFRDTTCEGERAQFQGGTIAPQVFWSCMDRLTRLRNSEFRAMM